MKRKDQLFSLVQSMSKAEKRHFKLYVDTQKGEKNYLKLFNILLKMTEYQEDVIIQTFKKEKFIKQLHVTKNYLYHLILQSLVQLDVKKNVKTQVNELIHKADILFKKNLANQAAKLLKKAKKMAKEYELHLQLLEIGELERTILFPQLKPTDFQALLNELASNEADLLRKYQNKKTFSQLYYEFLTFNTQKGIIRNKEEAKTIESFVEPEEMQNIEKATTFLSRCYYYIIWSNYYWYKKEHQKRYDIGLEFTEFFEARPHMRKEYDKFYAAAYQIVLGSSFFLEKYDRMDELLHKYFQLPNIFKGEKQQQLKKRVYPSYYNMALSYYMLSFQLEKSHRIIQEIERSDQLLKTIEKVVIWNTVITIYFQHSEYENALHWLNKLLNLNPTSIRDNILAFARVRELIIHYELQNYDYLPYLIRNTRRFLANRDQYYLLESNLIGCFNKLLKSISQKEVKTHLQKLKDNLQQIKDDHENTIPDTLYNELLTWIESKLQNKSYIEILKIKN